MAVRYGALSPRTTELPKAFTPAEFMRGALTAFFVFQPLGMAIAFVSGAIVPWSLPAGSSTNIWAASATFALIGVIFGGIYGLPFSAAGLIVGAPFAYLLGRALQRVRVDGIHLFVFAAFGLVIGVTAMMAADATMSSVAGSGVQPPDLSDVSHDAPFYCAAGVAVAFGRLVALRKARKTDAILLGVRYIAEQLE